MKVLLDTRTFIWWNIDDAQLSRNAREIIANGQNQVFLSAASAWEIAIKVTEGKLTLPEEPAVYVAERMKRSHILPLPVQISHAMHVCALPRHHENPFSHLLVAQSQLERIPLLTMDPEIKKYEVVTIW